MFLVSTAGPSRIGLCSRLIHVSSVRLVAKGRSPKKGISKTAPNTNSRATPATARPSPVKATTAPLSALPVSHPTITPRPPSAAPPGQAGSLNRTGSIPSGTASSTSPSESSKPLVPQATHPTPPFKSGIASLSPVGSPKTAAVPAPPPPPNWPWESVPSSDPDTTLQERIIFARPLEVNPRFVFLPWVAGVSALAILVIIPFFVPLADSEKSDKNYEELIEKLSKSESRNERAFAQYLNYSKPVAFLLMGAALIVAPVWTYGLSRMITRITQVRSSMPDGDSRENVRIVTELALAFSKNTKGKEYAAREITLSMINSQKRSHWVKLQLNRSTVFRPLEALEKRWFHAYRMNFGETHGLKETADTVVLSFKRLESVFGPIAPPPRPMVTSTTPRFGDGLFSILKRFSDKPSVKQKS